MHSHTFRDSPMRSRTFIGDAIYADDADCSDYDAQDRTSFGTDLSAAGLNLPPGQAGASRSQASIDSGSSGQAPALVDPDLGTSGVSLPGYNPTGYSHGLIQAAQDLWDSGAPSAAAAAPPAPPVQLQPIPQPEPSYSGEAEDRIHAIKYARQRLAQYLRQVPEVAAVRIGVCGQQPCITVHLARTTRARIPTSVRGIRVRTVFGLPTESLATRRQFGVDASVPSPQSTQARDAGTDPAVINATTCGIIGGVVGTTASAGLLYWLGGKMAMLAAPIVGVFIAVPVAVNLYNIIKSPRQINS